MKTNSGREGLVHQGFLFYLESKTDVKAIWKCSQYKSTNAKCSARMHVQNNEITKMMPDPMEHNHIAQPAELEVRRHLNNMKTEASTSVFGST